MNDKTQAATLTPLRDANLTLSNPDEDIRGRKLVDRHGEDVGNVDDLIVDESEGKVRFLLVGVGGFLGIGEKKLLIPVDAITAIGSESIRIDQTGDRVAESPSYDPKLVDERYWSDLYGYYGYTPYWGTGYVYPRFPYYGY